MKILLMLTLVAIMLCGCESTPKTYDDCILKNIEKSSSDMAAALVWASCAKKFQKPNPFDKFDQDSPGR